MKENKLNILFIVSEFYQAGTERFTYELDKALNREKFNISILSLLPLNNNLYFTDYYFEQHKALGTNIFFLQEIDQIRVPTIQDRLKRKLFGSNLPNAHDALLQFYDQFNYISIMGEYNYALATRWMTDVHKKKCLIHIMNSKHQFPQIYNNFNKNESYNFCSGFKENEIKEELDGFISFRHFYFPLAINIEKDSPVWRYPANKLKKIAIFTRITNTKPLDPFLHAFHILKNKMGSVELHVFGQADSEINRIKQMIGYLSIQGNVHFRGHTENISNTCQTEDINLVWFHSFYGVPGGFAGFDISVLGVPQIFWNFTQSINDSILEDLPVFNNLVKFVETSIELIKSPEKAEKLALNQFNYLCENRNIGRFVHIMENLYMNKAKEIK